MKPYGVKSREHNGDPCDKFYKSKSTRRKNLKRRIKPAKARERRLNIINHNQELK